MTRHAPHITALALLAALMIGPARAGGQGDLPSGLVSAELLPGWVDGAGNRVSALKLVLEPGWKTYWRSPGESGIPPEFDWQGGNVGAVTMHWPAPEVIMSEGVRTLGYHDSLILPFTVTPQLADQPVELAAEVSFGLCREVCVPAQMQLAAAPPAATPDPVITEAMELVPRVGETVPTCEISEIEDGMKVTIALPEKGKELAVEYAGDDSVWVSNPDISTERGEVTVDLVGPTGAPFALAGADLVLTMLGPEGAVEYRGCAS